MDGDSVSWFQLSMPIGRSHQLQHQPLIAGEIKEVCMQNHPMNGDSTSAAGESGNNDRGQTKRTKHDFFDWINILSMPVMLTLLTIVGTWYIEEMQTRSEERISEFEREAADLRAERQMNLQRERAKDEQDLERLRQINKIFKDIIKADVSNNLEEVKLNITSFQVYEHTAIPFLLSIHDHFNHEKKDIREHIGGTIETILSNSQLSFKEKDLEFKDKIMRFANFENYDLSGAQFLRVNLYKSNFKNSTLKKGEKMKRVVCFKDTDLQSADFSSANLEGAQFHGNNLKDTNFSGTLLDSVKFSDNTCLEKAKFSLPTLLRVKKSNDGDTKSKDKGKEDDNDIFGEIDDDTYARLLSANYMRVKKEENGESIISEFIGDDRLDDVKKKLDASKLYDCNTQRGGWRWWPFSDPMIACLEKVYEEEAKWCL